MINRKEILKLAKQAGFSTQYNHIEYTEYEENLWGGRSQTDNLIRYTELLLKEYRSESDV